MIDRHLERDLDTATDSRHIDEHTAVPTFSYSFVLNLSISAVGPIFK